MSASTPIAPTTLDESRRRIRDALLAARRVAVGTHAGEEVRVRMMHPGAWLPGLSYVAEAPDGRRHRLEVHQAAREVGLDRTALAQLYKGEPKLLATENQDRVITEAGRARLTSA